MGCGPCRRAGSCRYGVGGLPSSSGDRTAQSHPISCRCLTLTFCSFPSRRFGWRCRKRRWDMTQESDTAHVMPFHLHPRPYARHPHFLLVGTVLSLPLWGALLGGAALALAGVRGLLETEPRAPDLTLGGAVPEVVL